MSEIFIEVHPARATEDLVAPRPVVPEEFQQRAGEIVDSIAGIVQEFRTQFDAKLQAAPAEKRWNLDTVELNFQLAVQAEAGIIIARATTGATFSARLIWRARTDGG